MKGSKSLCAPIASNFQAKQVPIAHAASKKHQFREHMGCGSVALHDHGVPNSDRGIWL
jgi:hypothetical protein